ncbi:hypothetical protein MAPG_07537 [Magnaporthiopsis poae ATCC 64411]|uniref:Uncharacterized protein n=1 Tax=Magnaporthiopsis poae (strain ATCC 64411 / 73-15) TaxID=644358 RepID=A0A0C4E4Y1_MAGP6|nr:hypothetical protein MAPG_07537 [Magnaporthiopsis poae ATCC 64411]
MMGNEERQEGCNVPRTRTRPARTVTGGTDLLPEMSGVGIFVRARHTCRFDARPSPLYFTRSCAPDVLLRPTQAKMLGRFGAWEGNVLDSIYPSSSQPRPQPSFSCGDHESHCLFALVCLNTVNGWHVTDFI